MSIDTEFKQIVSASLEAAAAHAALATPPSVQDRVFKLLAREEAEEVTQKPGF